MAELLDPSPSIIPPLEVWTLCASGRALILLDSCLHPLSPNPPPCGGNVMDSAFSWFVLADLSLSTSSGALTRGWSRRSRTSADATTTERVGQATRQPNHVDESAVLQSAMTNRRKILGTDLRFHWWSSIALVYRLLLRPLPLRGLFEVPLCSPRSSQKQI